jgi:CMD domain protein
MSTADVIDQLAGLTPGSPLSVIRDRKPITRDQAQASYRALFEPADPAGVSLQERFALATFVAALHAEDGIASFYQERLALTAPPPGFVAALVAEAARAPAQGPYGAYPSGPLTVEDVPGPTHAVSAENAAVLGPRLSAALAHIHMLVCHPRDARPALLQALLDAGWTNTDIVTMSQLVAFLAFQIRTIVGLRALSAAMA